MKWDKIFSTIIGFLGGILGYLFGEPDSFLYCLIAFTLIDYISGVFAAGINRELSSKIGLVGICKKAFIFLVVATGNIADTVLLGGESVLRTAVISFFIMNELISILENASRAGIKVPPVFDKLIHLLKSKKDENESEEKPKKDENIDNKD